MTITKNRRTDTFVFAVEFPDARIDDDEILILDLRSARVSKRYLGCINRAKPPADPGAADR